ncbi:MAG: 1,4-alpha-glucan branching protein GlgB [Planctomycetes bacterium]|nr:1,4-alpha-glucan branching protein GlgB [Planctomycetota bacterium]
MTSRKKTTKRQPKRSPAERSPARPAPREAPPGVPSDRPWSRLSDLDLHLFNEGRHDRMYEKLGAHLATHDGRDGTYFAVWAPNGAAVSVIGDFNGWRKDVTSLAPRGVSGIWEGFVPDVGNGQLYKYHVRSHHDGYCVDKADPYGRLHEAPPKTASVVYRSTYQWRDAEWLAERARRQARDAPISIYELHPGSWRRRDGEPLGYRELAAPLIEHLRTTRFTHVELMPVMEHPFYGSWGYQTTGYFAPSSRYGEPDDLRHLVDELHRAGIGVILDWVPSHFPSDEHGLAYFDGTHLYEHGDPRRGFHPDWNSMIFDYGRPEVASFLCSSARFWIDSFHADGLRVDAVASMLYLDYSRKEGEWIPNESGGRENNDAIAFLRRMNDAVHRDFPDVLTIAEESTAWPRVSRPTQDGGLGFDMKWDMGWMHDTLHYFRLDPIARKHHHGNLTFRSLYAWHEDFVLSLSHDEVVHGKGSLLGKMPGDEWQRFANLRLLLAHAVATPGKKLLFMGTELAQWNEWNHDAELDWHLLADGRHGGTQRLVSDLNGLYREHAALHELDFSPDGFEWIDVENSANSIVIVLRKGRDADARMLVALNFTPVPRTNYRCGVPRDAVWREVLNTDAKIYGGSGYGNFGALVATPVPVRDHALSLNLVLPPLAAVFLALDPDTDPDGVDEVVP